MCETIQTQQLNKNNSWRYIKIAGLVFISVIALMIDADQANVNSNVGDGVQAFLTLFRVELRDVEPAHALLLPCLAAFYNKILFRERQPFSKTSAVVGGILSFFLLLGMSLAATADFSFIAGRKCQMLIAMITFLGMWVILYTCLKWLYEKMDHIEVKQHSYSGILQKITQNFLPFCVIIILICWGIMYMTYFPGSVPHDGRYQLNQFFGYFSYNLHHPIYSTLVMGAIYKLGYLIGGDIGGCVAYVTFQSIFGAIVFGNVCKYIYIKSKSFICGGICLAFYALTPVWWAYMQAVIKDTLFFVFFTWFILEITKQFYKDGGQFGVLRMIFAAIMSCLLKNGASLIVLPALLLLMIASHEKKRILCVAFAIVLVMNYVFNTLLVDLAGLKSANQVESLSIPLQQIARWVTLYEDEVTEEEKEIINNVVTYDGIPDRYNPELSDPIKNRYKNTTEEQWEAFWKLWWEKLLKHPIVYIEAAMNEVYGYIDPFYFYSGMATYQLYNKDSLGEYDEGVEYSTYLTSDELRKEVSDVSYSWNKIPGLSFLVNPGFYTWMGIILIGGLLRKKRWRETMLFTAPLMSVLICFASPVNGLVRYALPVMATMPLYILIGIIPYCQMNDSLEKMKETIQVGKESLENLEQ